MSSPEQHLEFVEEREHDLETSKDHGAVGIEISDAENRRLRRKMYKNLLPVMCLAYITQSLDKGTLGNSSIMGWQASVGAVGQDYALTGTFLWVGIILGEPLVNQFIRRLPVAKVLGGLMVIWSILVLGLTFCLNVPGVFVIRVLLGFFESSFGPCLITITVQWFTVEEQTFITTIWQAMFGAAAAFASILAYGCYHIAGRNPLYGWQWMTLIIAIISFVALGLVLAFLPDTPQQSRWATEVEKKLYVERVRANDQGIKQKEWRKTLVVGGLNIFNSLLINKAFGFDVLTALLVGIALAVCQVCLYFLIGWLGTKTKQTVYCMIGYTCVNIGGTVVLLTVEPNSSTRAGLLVAFYLMQCFHSVSPSMFAMLSRNVAGQTKKSIVYAMFFIGWAGGNSIGPQLFQAAWAPRYFNTLYIHLGLYGLFIAIIMTLRFILCKRNLEQETALAAAGEINQHLHAFEDMTEKTNKDFCYSY